MIVVTAARGRAVVRALRERGEQHVTSRSEHLGGLPGAAHRVGERPG